MRLLDFNEKMGIINWGKARQSLVSKLETADFCRRVYLIWQNFLSWRVQTLSNLNGLSWRVQTLSNLDGLSWRVQTLSNMDA